MELLVEVGLDVLFVLLNIDIFGTKFTIDRIHLLNSQGIKKPFIDMELARSILLPLLLKLDPPREVLTDLPEKGITLHLE